MSRHNFYTGAGLDRATHLRKDEAWLAESLADPRSRLVPVWRARNLVAGYSGDGEPFGAIMRGASALGERVSPVLLEAPAVRPHIESGAAVVLLGLAEEVAHFAIDLSHLEAPEEAPELAGLGRFTDLRAVGPLMGQAQGALLAYARGMLHWHNRHRFCGRCGSETRSAEAGHMRACLNPDCGASHFPRTDPAVIMLVTRGDMCLLGRQAAWPPGMHSTLAGFVEPGESLEEAVAREVHEETGVRVADVRYCSSQPWPFPSSLMLGFRATALDEEIRVFEDELEDARWFSRDFVRGHEPDERFRTPRTDSIAWRLIKDWLDEG